MRVLRVLACAGLLALCFVADMAAARAASKSPARSKALDDAVVELKREFAAYAKNPAAAPLRTECDYFKPDASIPVEAVLAALEKPIAGGGRQSAYVKWQLLSALPETVEPADAPRLAKVYQRAPAPAMRYGCSPAEQRELDRVLARARPQDDVMLTEQLQALVDRGFAADQPVIAYRDALYRRLPAGREKFIAGLIDVHTRLGAAAPIEALAEALQTELPRWAIGADPGPGEVGEVAELLGKLRFVESPRYYASAGVRRGKLTWVTDTDMLLTKKKSAALHKQLLDVAAIQAATVPAGSADGGRAAQAGGKN